MRTGSILFLCGIMSLLLIPGLPPGYFACLLPLCLYLGRRFPLLARPMWFVCGLLWALFRADLMLQNTLPADLEGRDLSIEGTIVSLPAQISGGQRFIFELDRLLDQQGRERPRPGRVRLYWYGAKTALVPGDRWRLSVRLKRPHGFMNPGGFDYEAWLFQRRIRATGYVSSSRRSVRLAGGQPYNYQRLRYSMRTKLVQVLHSDNHAGSLVPALVLGDHSLIRPAQWQVLRATGTSHLLAISGLHIGLIATVIYFLARWLWPLGCISALIIPAPRVAALCAMLAAVCYAAMAGFSIPTQRALVMLAAVLWTSFISRKVLPSAVITLALLLVLLIDPFAVLAAGFWLSFAAIAVLAFGMSARIGVGGLWWRWGRAQYVVAIGLFPLLLVWFQQIPLLSIGANLLFVPWVSFITVPLVLSGSIAVWIHQAAGSGLLQLGIASIDLFWPFLERLAGLDFSLLALPQPGYGALSAAVIGVLLLLMPRGLPGRWLGLIWLLPLLFPVQDRAAAGEARLTLLDVGQGLAAVLETRNHVLLFDTGPRYSRRFDTGTAVIIPYFRQRHLRHIDVLIQSHGDNDHIGGLATILAALPINRILTSVPGRIRHAHVAACQRGQAWNWDGVAFRIIHPGENSGFSGNDRSCVLKVSAAGGSILFTGDIEARAEQRILQRDRDKLAANILLAPHHGSRSSSTPDFIAAVDPEYVLFAVGYGNRFGFPKKDIIRRYRERGVKILDTARNGAIDMHIMAGEITVRRYRQYAQHFWNLAYHQECKLTRSKRCLN